jgi:hypothetical protein
MHQPERKSLQGAVQVNAQSLSPTNKEQPLILSSFRYCGGKARAEHHDTISGASNPQRQTKGDQSKKPMPACVSRTTKFFEYSVAAYQPQGAGNLTREYPGTSIESIDTVH